MINSFEANRENHRKANLKWRTKNKERVIAATVAWQRANPDKRAKNSQKYFVANREVYRKRNHRSYEKCRDRLSTGYVRLLIARKAGIKAADIPIKLIEAKRSQLMVYRLLRRKHENELA